MLPHNIQHVGLIQLEGVMAHELLDTCKVFMQSFNFNQVGNRVQIMTFKYVSLTFLCAILSDGELSVKQAESSYSFCFLF